MQSTKKKFIISFALLAACLLFSCKAAKEQHPETADQGSFEKLSGESGAVQQNRSQIVATVLGVVRSEEPRFHLRLRIENVEAVAGYENAVKTGQVIEAYPNFKREEGKELDYTSEGNKHLLNAGNLKEGNRITAVVYYRGNSVLLMDWQQE